MIQFFIGSCYLKDVDFWLIVCTISYLTNIRHSFTVSPEEISLLLALPIWRERRASKSCPNISPSFVIPGTPAFLIFFVPSKFSFFAIPSAQNLFSPDILELYQIVYMILLPDTPHPVTFLLPV